MQIENSTNENIKWQINYINFNQFGGKRRKLLKELYTILTTIEYIIIGNKDAFIKI